MQALIEAFIWVGLLGLFLLFVVYVPWVQRIWIKNGKWYTLYFVLVIVSLLIIKDAIVKAFAGQITANLVAQGVGFGVLYAIYALLVLLLSVGLIVSAYKTAQSSPFGMSMAIYAVLCVLMLSLPFWV